jgi:hypothetical protein
MVRGAWGVNSFRSAPADPRFTLHSVLVLFSLYTVGLLHWIVFFNCGRLTFRSYDWPKEVMYLEVLQNALCEGRLPLHILVPWPYASQFPQLINYPQELVADVPVRCRFLGLPETVLSPQIVLLPLMPVGRFIMVNHLVLYSLGFLGSLFIKRRYGLSLIPFAAFFVLFNFNGYITAHLAVGHSMWSGYFLLPFFVLFTLEWVERERSFLAPLKMALVLAAMLLQGSFHMVTWCWILVGLIVVVRWRSWKEGLVIVGFCGVLAAFRIIPSAIAFWRFDRLPFGGGYPTLADVPDALLWIHEPSYGMENGLFWWEYDLFIGIVGLAFLIYFGICLRFARSPNFDSCRYALLDMPLILLAILSLDSLYLPIYRCGIPFLNGERVTSRFLIIPVVMVMALASVRMQRWWEGEGSRWLRKGLLTVAVVVMLLYLMMHTRVWLIAPMESDPATFWHEQETACMLTDVPDAFYRASIAGSAVLSIVALAGWGYALLRAQRLEAG